MSNPFAVAAVTATFAQLLRGVIEEPTLTGATVSTLRPDAAVGAGGGRRLNLFLYDMRPNGALRNADLPNRRSDGRFAIAPVTALDLHYLVTAFGLNDDELDAHHLMAQAMSIVNDAPVLTPSQISAALTAQPAVGPSDLADQVDLVRITPEPLSMDDLSKLWGMFQNAQYRLSVSYRASVVLIERPHPTTSAPPVRRSGLIVRSLRRPVIEAVVPLIVPSGNTLVIQGRNLRADLLRVLVAGAAAPTSKVTDRRIELIVPSDRKAGVATLQVVHPIAMGSPPTPHRGFESNVAAFILAPRIITATPASVARGSVLTLDFAPAVTRDQSLSVLFGDREIRVLPNDIGNAPVTQMDFPVPSSFPRGTFLLRLRVNAADSLLEVDTDPTSPTFDEFIGPNVTVT